MDHRESFQVQTLPSWQSHLSYQREGLVVGTITAVTDTDPPLRSNSKISNC